MKITDKGVKIYLASYFVVFITSAIVYATNPSFKWLLYVLSGLTALSIGVFLLRDKIFKG